MNTQPVRHVCARCGSDVKPDEFTRLDDRFGTGFCSNMKVMGHARRYPGMAKDDPTAYGEPPRVKTIAVNLYPALDAKRKRKAEVRKLLNLVKKKLSPVDDPKLAARIQKAEVRLEALGVKWR